MFAPGLALLRVRDQTVETPVSSIMKYQQGTVFSVTPMGSSDHISFGSAQNVLCLEELEIASQIFAAIVMRHFLILIGILFTSHQLLDAGETKLLESKQVLGHHSIEAVEATKATITRLGILFWNRLLHSKCC